MCILLKFAFVITYTSEAANQLLMILQHDLNLAAFFAVILTLQECQTCDINRNPGFKGLCSTFHGK